jgi:hypothetical protein
MVEHADAGEASVYLLTTLMAVRFPGRSTFLGSSWSAQTRSEATTGAKERRFVCETSQKSAEKNAAT